MKKSPVKIGLLGANGRMGQEVQKLVAAEFSKQATITAKVSESDSPEPLFDCHCVIDFSTPDATREFIDLCLTRKKGLPALVSGTTGLNEETQGQLHRLSKKTAVLAATNFSVGVFTLNWVLGAVAKQLKKHGFSASIREVHHVHKKDAPSGTALTLQFTLGQFGYETPIESIRKDEVVGTHTVTFSGEGEKLVFEHDAKDRTIFARGAIKAALWAASQKPGDYSLEDCFGSAKS